MKLRFRKRIKIMPGLWINLSKGAPSLSMGGHGATINVGKRGLKGTLGLPGSGLSVSETVPWHKPKGGDKPGRGPNGGSKPAPQMLPPATLKSDKPVKIEGFNSPWAAPIPKELLPPPPLNIEAVRNAEPRIRALIMESAPKIIAAMKAEGRLIDAVESQAQLDAMVAIWNPKIEPVKDPDFLGLIGKAARI